MSRVSKGSVLGPLFIDIYINSVDRGINSKISKFVDAMNVGKLIRTGHDAIVLQYIKSGFLNLFTVVTPA